ncbi:hypothetical protein HGH93_02360 [Chitinophaga polysaccharea]|uniref:hypothetical protein n=1 Tax=Chitinophaga polysaccharea TaxID=1293035 RepID=UPI0014554A7C|nr:hypothetical protein [Chitinophaga polysaccharea]NLR56928.1 hypothetical protein [Chitinophaga polysaccharea]
MADFKRRTLQLSSGKQIKLFGNSMAIGKSLELGEGYRPNILACNDGFSESNSSASVYNPFRLTREELIELADYNIQLWMDLKKNIYKYGMDSPMIFEMELPSQNKSTKPWPKKNGSEMDVSLKMDDKL